MTRVCAILIAVVPLLAYRVMSDDAPAALVAALVASQFAAVCWMLASRIAQRERLALAVVAFASMYAGISLSGASGRAVGIAGGGICHALIYSCLLIWFAHSLLPGREPMVTRLARRIRQTMPERVERYTRAVTMAWCLFFLAQLVTSSVLFLTKPVDVWSVFVEFLNLPLVVVMVLAEFACRQVLFRHEQRSSLWATIAAMRNADSPSGHR